MKLQVTDVPKKYRSNVVEYNEKLEEYSKVLKENKMTLAEYRTLMGNLKAKTEMKMLATTVDEMADKQMAMDIMIKLTKTAIESFI